MQVWGTSKYGSAGITAYKGDLLTLRAGIDYDFDLKSVSLRVVVFGLTLWADAYFKPSVFGVEDNEAGFGFTK